VGAVRTTRQTPNVSRPLDCDGAEGTIELECSDERRLSGRWRSGKQCGAGYGTGSDQQGNGFYLAYGMSRETAGLMAREAIAELADRPALPNADEERAAAGIRSGTAFFVSEAGHLVTNYHVIAGAERIQVVLDGEELLTAELVAEDEANDLAVLRVPAIRPVLHVRRRPALAKGQQVFTLGYPLLGLQGREQKATFGRINSLTGLRGDERYAQVDVPIQPGNSGGPLLNTAGEVVGVMTAMLSQQAAFETAGVLPQNVNYALKSGVLHQLLRSAVGADLPEPETLADRGFEALISASQDSVVIVLAE
jgi:S1-C subfamily serine protease